jgi:type I restriction enzyme M protein
MQFEEFTDCLAWWNKREETERAWKVPVAELLTGGCNLDYKNPRAKEDIAHLPPQQLAESIRHKELQIAEIMRNITALLGKDLP